MDFSHLNSFLLKAIEWLNPAVHLVGLAIAITTFIRCRKCGYLVIAAYFAMVAFSLLAVPYINRLSTPAFSNSDQQKFEAAFQQAVEQIEKQSGHPLVQSRNVNIPLVPIVLVIGVWLIARCESKVNREPPTNDSSNR